MKEEKAIERHYCGNGEGMFEDSKGAWVRYEDVKHLIELTNQHNQQPEQGEVDLISLSMQHLDKMNKELDETGLVPNWWRGVVTISMTAIEEFENIIQNKVLREAAEKAFNQARKQTSMLGEKDVQMTDYLISPKYKTFDDYWNSKKH